MSYLNLANLFKIVDYLVDGSFSLHMAAVDFPPPVMTLLLEFAGFPVANSLSKTLSDSIDKNALEADAVLNFRFKVHKVCELIPYQVNEKRLYKFIQFAAASDDIELMDPDTFGQVCVLQLALTHLRNSKTALSVTQEEICLLLLRSISDRFVPDHDVSVQVINYLRERRIITQIDVGHNIPHISFAWRKLLFGYLSLESFMVLLTELGEWARC